MTTIQAGIDQAKRQRLFGRGGHPGPDTIYTHVVDAATGGTLLSGSRSTYEWSDDTLLAGAVLEFKYAARREEKAMVLVIVPRWVGLFLQRFGALRGLVRVPE